MVGVQWWEWWGNAYPIWKSVLSAALFAGELLSMLLAIADVSGNFPLFQL